MKKQVLKWMLAFAMTGMLLTGCGNSEKQADVQQMEEEQTKEVQTEETQEASEESADENEVEEEVATNETETVQEADENLVNDAVIRVGGLKGPTTMGLAKLLEDAKTDEGQLQVEFTLAAAADELTPKLIQGEMDMAAVPCNLASVLYNKTEGQIQILCTNTLGVLSIVDTGDSVKSIADLKGKTIYATGQGTTPEYCLKYLLKANGLDMDKDVTMEWKSEATEVVAAMSQATDEVIAMLPQPFVTVAMTQVEGLKIAVDLNEAWNEQENGSSLVTGVLVARKAFVEANKELVDSFLEKYKASCEYANNFVEETAAFVEALDIVKAPIAQKALPYCHITYMDGEEMLEAVDGYLQILNDMDPKCIGGMLPGEDFYYVR